jgi:hypothetical protein
MTTIHISEVGIIPAPFNEGFEILYLDEINKECSFVNVSFFYRILKNNCSVL